MNVQDLIEALKKQDPATNAYAALRAIRAEAAAKEQARSLTPAGIRETHVRNHEHAKHHTDCKGNSNDNPDACAFHGTRSDVFAALQAKEPPPGPHPDDDGDPELHHARQKAHNKKLWKQADALVASAGITEKGLVS